MRDLFIYWHARVDQAELALRQAQHLQASLRSAHPGLSAHLYRRADAAGQRVTMMETYSMAPGGVPEALTRHIVEHGGESLAQCIEGTRHLEIFERCDPSA